MEVPDTLGQQSTSLREAGKVIAPYMLDPGEQLWKKSGIMRACLYYKGFISTTHQTANIHSLRRSFQPQLRRLWQTEECLKHLANREHLFWDDQLIGFVSQESDDSWVAMPLGVLPSGGYRQREHASYVVAAYAGLLDPEWARPVWFETPGIHASAAQKNVRQQTTFKPGIDVISERFDVGGARYLPLVTTELSLMCYIKMTLWRHDGPGSLVRNNGDLDNVLKTVFDALRVPSSKGEVPDHDDTNTPTAPTENEKPFYCLLEDDRLISGFEINSEQWLEPTSTRKEERDFQISLTAVIRPTKVNDVNVSFLGGM